MSVDPSQTDETLTTCRLERYAELLIGDDEFIVYDRENPQSWVQSSISVPLDELR
jgi:hypothetical protein